MRLQSIRFTEKKSKLWKGKAIYLKSKTFKSSENGTRIQLCFPVQVHKQPVPFLFQLEGISSLLFLVIVFAALEMERTQGLGRAKQI